MKKKIKNIKTKGTFHASPHQKVLMRMRKYEKNSFLEQYAIFMGKAQIVELLLKQSLINDKGYKEKELEKTTMGGLLYALRTEKANSTLLLLLEELVEYRNLLAHELLANKAMMSIFLGKKIKEYTKPQRRLVKALFSVEQMLVNLENARRGGL